jgi:hypothetical protein
MPDGTPTLRWIREIVRGETRTINQTLELLRDGLNRDLRGSWLGREALVLAGGVFEATRKRFYVQIANINARFETQPEFRLVVLEVPDGAVNATGAGGCAVSVRGRELLKQQLAIRPRSWDDHMGLLAAVNRRAALADPLKSVSA